ncbi:MAG: ATP-binding cassette domain-containing protein, partial [Nitrospinota bacterium]
MSRLYLAGVMAVLVVLLLPLGGNDYLLHIGTISWYYGILAASWVLLAGYAGQFSFAHMALAALGGYTSALLLHYLHLPLPLALLSGMVAPALVGGIIGWLCLRMSGPYLALFTVAFSEIFRILLVAEYRFTRGSLGLHVPPLFPGAAKTVYFYTSFGLLLASLALMHLVLRSRIGLFLRALREDERAAAASGVNTVQYKILAFVLASGFAGLAGIFYGHYVGILTPNIAEIPQMGLIIAMAVIGGVESLPGAVVGAVFVELLSEGLREYGQWRLVLFGLILLLTQRFTRNGLVAPILARLKRPSLPLSKQGEERKAPVVPEVVLRGQSHPVKDRPEAPLLETEGLVKRFGGVVAVNNLSLTIHPGELVGLIGPNGSGKTTFINLVSGALHPDRGHIRLAGTLMHQRPPYEFARRGVARTFQITQPFRRMTVLENLLVPALTRPEANWEAAREKGEAILHFLGLLPLAWEEARNLSGGQQKLLELGRALML